MCLTMNQKLCSLFLDCHKDKGKGLKTTVFLNTKIIFVLLISILEKNVYLYITTNSMLYEKGEVLLYKTDLIGFINDFTVKIKIEFQIFDYIYLHFKRVQSRQIIHKIMKKY